MRNLPFNLQDVEPVTVQRRGAVPLFRTCKPGMEASEVWPGFVTLTNTRGRSSHHSARRIREYLHHVSFGLMRWAEPYWCCYVGYLHGRSNCLFYGIIIIRRMVARAGPSLLVRTSLEHAQNNADTRSLIYAMF
jgi:hypothetical protein